MVEYFPYLLLLLIVIVGITMLANRIRVAYPILLVFGGLALAFIPKLPIMAIDPNWVLLIFLPPLLYADSWVLSPRSCGSGDVLSLVLLLLSSLSQQRW